MIEQFNIQRQPGFIFSRLERKLSIPVESPNERAFKQLAPYHFASNTEKVYSPFQHNFYRPPHLNASQAKGLINRGECRGWQIKHKKQKYPDPSGKYRYENDDKNYDMQYQQYEERVKATLENYEKWKYSYVGSRAKYNFDEDKQMFRATSTDYHQNSKKRTAKKQKKTYKKSPVESEEEQILAEEVQEDEVVRRQFSSDEDDSN